MPPSTWGTVVLESIDAALSRCGAGFAKGLYFPILDAETQSFRPWHSVRGTSTNRGTGARRSFRAWASAMPLAVALAALNWLSCCFAFGILCHSLADVGGLVLGHSVHTSCQHHALLIFSLRWSDSSARPATHSSCSRSLAHRLSPASQRCVTV